MNGVLGPAAHDAVIAGFVLFARLGACLMLMPGSSSARVPVRVRLMLAIAVSLALLPILAPEAKRIGTEVSPLLLLRTIGAETLTGALIGLMARLFFLALETLATAAAFHVGLSSALQAPIDESLPLPPLTTLLTLGATMLLFATDQHLEILRGLIASYRVLPVDGGFGSQFALVRLTETATQAFEVALRVSSPFLIYAVVVNLALGLLNRMVPQVPVYFISLPFVVGGGLLLASIVARPALDAFMVAFSRWLVR